MALVPAKVPPPIPLVNSPDEAIAIRYFLKEVPMERQLTLFSSSLRTSTEAAL